MRIYLFPIIFLLVSVLISTGIGQKMIDIVSYERKFKLRSGSIETIGPSIKPEMNKKVTNYSSLIVEIPWNLTVKIPNHDSKEIPDVKLEAFVPESEYLVETPVGESLRVIMKISLSSESLIMLEPPLRLIISSCGKHTTIEITKIPTEIILIAKEYNTGFVPAKDTLPFENFSNPRHKRGICVGMSLLTSHYFEKVFKPGGDFRRLSEWDPILLKKISILSHEIYFSDGRQPELFERLNLFLVNLAQARKYTLLEAYRKLQDMLQGKTDLSSIDLEDQIDLISVFVPLFLKSSVRSILSFLDIVTASLERVFEQVVNSLSLGKLPLLLIAGSRLGVDHVVVPFALKFDVYTNRYAIHVYDPNYPNEERVIKFDFSSKFDIYYYTKQNYKTDEYALPLGVLDPYVERKESFLLDLGGELYSEIMEKMIERLLTSKPFPLHIKPKVTIDSEEFQYELKVGENEYKNVGIPILYIYTRKDSSNFHKTKIFIGTPKSVTKLRVSIVPLESIQNSFNGEIVQILEPLTIFENENVFEIELRNVPTYYFIYPENTSLMFDTGVIEFIFDPTESWKVR